MEVFWCSVNFGDDLSTRIPFSDKLSYDLFIDTPCSVHAAPASKKVTISHARIKVSKKEFLVNNYSRVCSLCSLESHAPTIKAEVKNRCYSFSSASPKCSLATCKACGILVFI